MRETDQPRRFKFWFWYVGTITFAKVTTWDDPWKPNPDYDGLDLGEAICSPHDQFCKRTGRKVALTNWLDRRPLSRDARREIWTEYFRVHNDLKKGRSR